MFIKRKLAFCGFILLASFAFSSAADQNSISLKDCLKIGFENSKSLKIAKSKANSSTAKIEENKSLGLPSLKLSGGYTRLSEVDKPDYAKLMGISKPDTGGASSSSSGIGSLFPVILDNYSLKLTATQPIFTGNRISSNISMAEYSRNAAQADIEKESAQLTFDIKSAYWNLKKAFDIKKTIEENIEQVKAHIKDIENFEKNGLATLNDVLKVKLQLSNLELSKLDAEILIETNQLNLATIIGASNSAKYVPSDEANYKSVENLDLNKIKTEAVSKRSELKAFTERLKAANASVEMTKSGWFPQINAVANYTYSNPNQRIQPQQEKFKGTWDVGINFSYDIWNWSLTSHQTEQATANKEQTELAMMQFEDALVLDVTTSYLSLKKAYERIALTLETIKQAEENHRILKERFANGAALNSDLLDAETALLQAKISYSSALCDYEIANAKLSRSIGN